jgi:ribosomal protein S18 acetylase RimI-like enzyme
MAATRETKIALALAPDLGREGAPGRQIIELVEAEARTLGVRCLLLEVERTNRAVGFYRPAGYVDHQRYLMSKDL